MLVQSKQFTIAIETNFPENFTVLQTLEFYFLYNIG